MQNRTLNMFHSPGPSFEAQVRRQGDPSFIFVNAIPNVTSVRDHGVHIPSPYFQDASHNPFHEVPKSDRGIPTTFHSFNTPNPLEQRRQTNPPEYDPSDPRTLTNFNSKSIQNKYGLGVRILEKTPRNSNTAVDRSTGNRSHLGSDDLGRTEIRLVEPPRLNTPLKGQTVSYETDRVIRTTNIQTANMTSPTPNNVFQREVRNDQGVTVQRYDAYSGQTFTVTQPPNRVQVLNKTPQPVHPQSQTRITIPPLNLNNTESHRTVTPNGSLPRADQHPEAGVTISKNQTSAISNSNASPGYFFGQSFGNLTTNYVPNMSRNQSQPQDSQPVIPNNVPKPMSNQTIPLSINQDQVMDILRMNESRQAEDIITHHLPPAKDGSSQNQLNYPSTQNLRPAGKPHPPQPTQTDSSIATFNSPKTSQYHPQPPQTQTPSIPPQTVQSKLTEASHLSGELVRLNLEGIGSYEGTVRNNALNGYGKLTDSKGRLVYEGEFAGNQFEGIGILFNHESTGDRIEARSGTSIPDNWVRYEGLFHANQKSGNGYLFYGDGSQFAGEFDGDVASGFGALRSASGEVARGVWKNGVLVSRN